MPVDVMTTGEASSHPERQKLSQMITRRLATIFHALELPDPEVSVVLTDDETIRELNAQWRGIDEATDVLSFPIYEAGELPLAPPHLGDIVISVPCAQRMVLSQQHQQRVAEDLGVPADQLEWSLPEEVAFLFVHGLLHLVGYDHATADEEEQMREMEHRIWKMITTDSHPNGSHGTS